MTRTKRLKVPLLLSLWVLLIQTIMVIVFYLNPEWFEELGVVKGLILTPVFAGFLSLLLLIMGGVSKTIKKKLLVRVLIISILSAEILFLIGTGSFGLYFLEVHQKRFEYKEAYDYHKGLNNELNGIFNQILPSNWWVERAAYDKELNGYWFTVLQPSRLKGSIRYVGFVRDINTYQILSFEKIWSEATDLTKVPRGKKYSDPYFYVERATAKFTVKPYDFYELKLSYIDDRIIVEK